MTESEQNAPRRPWTAWLLSIPIPLVYWWYWYWHLVRDTRAAARTQGEPRLGPSQRVAVLLASAGSLLFVPLVVSLVQTSRLVKRTQHRSDTSRRCRAWLPPVAVVAGTALTLLAQASRGPGSVVFLVAGIGLVYWPTYYLQSHANEVPTSQPAPGHRASGGRLAVLAGAATVWTFVALPLVVLGGTGAVDGFKIPSGAMAPTIRCGDRVVVESLTARSGDPRRLDVVAFHAPDNPRQAPDARTRVDPGAAIFLKRVIGLPGDRVEMVGHRAVVNGEPLDEPYAQVPEFDSSGIADIGELEVPDGTYFMVGDHRDNSLDSRVFGFVPESFIVGRATWIYWPPDRFGALSAEAVRNGTTDVPDPACLG